LLGKHTPKEHVPFVERQVFEPGLAEVQNTPLFCEKFVHTPERHLNATHVVAVCRKTHS